MPEYHPGAGRVDAHQDLAKRPAPDPLISMGKRLARIPDFRPSKRYTAALEIAQTRFRNGLSTQVELNDAELAVTRARTNFVQALYNHNAARAQLTAAMGER